MSFEHRKNTILIELHNTISSDHGVGTRRGTRRRGDQTTVRRTSNGSNRCCVRAGDAFSALRMKNVRRSMGFRWVEGVGGEEGSEIAAAVKRDELVRPSWRFHGGAGSKTNAATNATASRGKCEGGRCVSGWFGAVKGEWRERGAATASGGCRG